MKQGQFQALHALRVRKGFQDCKAEDGACELEIAAALRAARSFEVDNEVPGAVEYFEAVVQGKLGSVAQERVLNNEGRVRELEEWERDSLRALRHVKQEGCFTVLEKNAIVCADREYAKLLRKLQE